MCYMRQVGSCLQFQQQEAANDQQAVLLTAL